MPTLRYANRTGQAGVFHTGTPDYVDVDNTFAGEAGYVTFAAKVAERSWATGDTVGVLVKKDNSNYKVWIASWDGANEYLLLVSEEESVGTISNADDVIVRAILTEEVLDNAITEPQIEVETGTTRALSGSDKGKVICCTNGSAVTITLTASLPVNFHCMIVQEGDGAVALARDSTDTINGGATNITLAGRYKSGYVYQRTEGTWIAVV